MRTPLVRPLRVPIRAAASALLILFLSVAVAQAQDSGKQLLSEEIRRVLEADGSEAAQRRFDEIYPEQSDRYEMDLEGLTMLGTERIQANDMASAQVVFAMVTALGQGQDFLASARTQQAQRDERDAARQAREERPAATGPGQPRDDLKRFAGWYGDPNQQGKRPRNIFIQETCDGYLVSGTSWGDAAPWYLTSVSETSFELDSEVTGFFTMELELDGDGDPVTLVHTIENLGVPNRAQYVGPLEDGDAKCWDVDWGR